MSSPVLSDPRLKATMRRHLRALNMTSVEAYLGWCRAQGFGARISKTLAQRQEELNAAKKDKARKQIQSDLDRHLAALEMTSVEAYQAWCRAQGFGDGLHKSSAHRQQEQHHAARAKAQALSARAAAHQHKRRRKETLELIAAGRIEEEELTSPVLLRVHFLFHQVLTEPAVKEAFLRLLVHVEKSSRFFHIKPAVAQYGPQPENTFIDALAALAQWQPLWIRAVDDWQPASHNARRQFGALARHLLAEYDIPVCMDTAWFRGMDDAAQQQQEWFIHIGMGRNIRKAAIPLEFSKKMAHIFINQAPDNYTIEAALRWAQVIGMGGDDHLADAVIESRLGDHFHEESFWASVLHFFINNPMLDTVHVGPIVDYLHHRRHVPEQRVNQEGAVEYLDPPEPNLTMKGRSPDILLRRVDAWHRGLSKEVQKEARRWPSSGFNGFTYVDEDPEAGEMRSWTIDEILDLSDLVEEGKVMRHCVATYKSSCINGHKSIWSMKVEFLSSRMTRRVLTIELVNHRRYIRQVRGRNNSRPLDAASGRAQTGWDVLKKWVQQEGLSLPGEHSQAMRRL